MNTFLSYISKNYYTLILCVIIFLLPYFIAITNVLVIIVILLLLKDTFIKKRTALAGINYKYSIPFVLMFVFYAISVLYSTDSRGALVTLERRIPFLVLPLAVFHLPLSKKDIETLFFAFITSIALSCIVTLFLTTCYFLQYPEEYYLEKALWYLPQPINFHAPYLALYLVVSNIICFYFFLEKKRKSIILLILILNNLFLILISSRTALFTNWAFIIGLSSYYFYKYKGITTTIINLVFIGAILSIAYFEVPYLHTKLSKLTETAYGVNQRAVSAQAALVVISDNPLWGVGLGDIQTELNKQLPDATYEDYNVHNQYLHELMAYGLIGFVCFITIFIIGYSRAISTKDVPFLLFLTVFLLSFLTEVILDRYKGIMLFSLFYPLFIILNRINANKKKAMHD